MKRLPLLSALLTFAVAPAWGATPVIVQDFEKTSGKPSVWVVNIPNESASVSQKRPFFFLINLATGGGWSVDLSRHNGVADMYVDYVRVYQGKK